MWIGRIVPRSSSAFRQALRIGKAQQIDLPITPTGFAVENVTLPPGSYRLNVRNESKKRSSLLFLQVPPGAVPTNLRFHPFLTGKRYLTSQTFKRLFSGECLRCGESIGVRNLTFLFTDLKGSTALYRRIGDLAAYSIVTQHFNRLVPRFSGIAAHWLRPWAIRSWPRSTRLKMRSEPLWRWSANLTL